jgi:energy-coupling factor transporter ATP-binding protein EcfA2
LAAVEPDVEPFLAWAEGEPWLLRRPVLLGAARLLPVLAFAAIGAALFGALPWGLGLLPALANLALSRGLGKRFDSAFDAVAAGERDILAYSAVLRLAAEAGLEGGRAGEIAAALTPQGTPAWRLMVSLRRRIEIADARHGSFHVIPQALLLWDFHALWLLERWQAACGRRVRGWLAALGELEALAALAALAHDQPGWTFPEVAADAPPVLVARDLGHPLLADAARVGNDVEVGPPGTFLLVTGSNMSGKSTLLRALGTNVVLAQAGGPVCAAALRLPPLRLATSIRVEDSLADGVSRFMAEVLRIRDVVDAARRGGSGGEGGERPLLLYLIDEALAGTNSRERQAAVRRVLGHLLASPAIGCITTHDLELAETEELRPGCHAVHFRETVHAEPVDGRMMTFDYRLRPGLATTSNALALLDLVGLGEGSTAG